jgi:transposase
MAGEVVMGRPLQISWQDDETALFQRYRAEKQPDLKPRLHALWLLRQEHSLTETARLLGVHYTSVQQWVAWYPQGGVAEVLSHRRIGPGSPPWLTPVQQAQLGAQEAQGRFRTARGAVQWVKETFGVAYKLKGMSSLLKRLKGKKKVPRPMATNTSLEAQEEWKRGARGCPYPGRGKAGPRSVVGR